MDKNKKLLQAISRQQAILQAAKDGSRALSEEETREFDNLQADIERLRGEIAAEAEPPVAATPPAESPAEQQRAVTQERQRITEINDLAREFDMDLSEHIRSGAGVDQVRRAVIEGLRASGSPVRTRVSDDSGDDYRAAMADALAVRSGATVERPAEGADRYRNMTLRDLGIECLSRDGNYTVNELLRMDRTELYDELARQFYNPTAAFPSILDATIKKNIVHMYNSVPTTFERWTSKGTVSDFKSTADHSYLIGGAGDFLLVPENGEIKHDTPKTQLLPQRKIDTYGRQFSMSRQAFINDDIGFLTEVPGLYAASAKKTIDKQVYKILFENPAIYDGAALFGASHKNLIASGGAPSQTTIQAIILQMQKQTDPFDEPIYMTPAFLIVPVGYEFNLAVIFNSAQTTGSANNDINPLYNYPLQVVQTPVLNSLAGTGAAPWFMVSDKSSAKSIQVDYLNGQETPTIRRMEQAGQLGFTWDIYLDWGVTSVDYRGIVKNPGAVIG